MADDPQTGAAELTIDAAARFFSMSEQELRVLSRNGIIPRVKSGKLPWIETTQRLIKHLREPRCSVLAGAALIGKSEIWLRKLISDGYIEQKDSLIRRDDAFLGYIRFLTDERRNSQKNASENRVRDARAKELEVRLAIRTRTLIELDEAIAAIERLAGMVRTEFSSLPAGFTRDLVQRALLEKAVNERFNRLATYLEAESVALQDGSGDPSDPGAIDAGSMGDEESDASAIIGVAGSA